VAIAETVFEPKVGGHIYDRGIHETPATEEASETVPA